MRFADLTRRRTTDGLTPRWATAGVFFVNGMGIGTLLPHLPYLREELQISKGVLGLCLLAMTVGALIAMPLTGQLLERRPSRSVLRAAVVVYPIVLAFPLLARSPELLAAILFFYGFANGTFDVSQNAHGAALERETGRPIMSSLHAGWSLGGVAGAGGAALAAAAGVDPRVYVACAAALLLVLGVALAARVGDARVTGEGGGGFVWPSRGVLLLGALCILVMVTEGAMNDWSAIYLREDLGAGADVAAAGFAIFSAGMAVGRIVGDAAVRRLGFELVLRGGMALAAVALGGLLLGGAVPPALAGLALVGLGVSNGVPLLFSAAGRTASPGPAIAAVSTMGYVAFLGGPPFLGFLADAVGLPTALATICAAAFVVVVLGGRAGTEDRAREAAAVA
jgi:predicted MFS family arabinose efflux permease